MSSEASPPAGVAHPPLQPLGERLARAFEAYDLLGTMVLLAEPDGRCPGARPNLALHDRDAAAQGARTAQLSDRRGDDYRDGTDYLLVGRAICRACGNSQQGWTVVEAQLLQF